VIYGHNGSGKSSFASLLFEIATDETSIEVQWEDEGARTHTVRVGRGGPSPAVAVFTKEWVRRNLLQFLEGATASPIVTLGEEAIEAKEQESELEQQIEGLRAKAAEADKKRRDSAAKAKKLATAAQDAIADQLREFSYERFTKNKYSLPVVQGKLRNYRGDFPDESKHAEALKRLGEGQAERVSVVSDPPRFNITSLDGLSALLAETPTRVALKALAADKDRQSWVERGMGLHENLEECLFCAGPVTSDRRELLARHFDQSWFQIRERAQSLLQEMRRARSDLTSWMSNIPDPKDLSSELRDGYAVYVQTVTDEVAIRMNALENIEDALASKAEDPSVAPPAPDWAVLTSNVSVAPLQRAVAEQNRQSDEHAVVVEGRFETVLNHIIGSRSDAFRNLEEQVQTAQEAATAANGGADLAQRTLGDIRQKKFSNNQMAETLTSDLARVYGKDHLCVAVTEDGKSYVCRRGDAPATHLSDGERTTLSLLYFLRKLEDETISGDKSTRIVVIDDPSSSLDREALFATHQWLVDTLKGFGQFIVLSHDFGLLRLFLKSQKNAWDTSRKKIRTGDAAEERFPKVAFLEMYASNDDGVRRTKVAALPSMLSKHTTEYAYLFSKVMHGVDAGADCDHLFLLPNAARRVLEVFSSYKAPHLSNFDQRLEVLMGDDSLSNPYRDVFDFCNRYSHGEGSESVDELDGRAIHRLISRCMEFLKFADAEHFERMCRATDVDENAASRL
jgi:wobble nucleotide-excising tRNase